MSRKFDISLKRAFITIKKSYIAQLSKEHDSGIYPIVDDYEIAGLMYSTEVVFLKETDGGILVSLQVWDESAPKKRSISQNFAKKTRFHNNQDTSTLKLPFLEITINRGNKN